MPPRPGGRLADCLGRGGPPPPGGAGRRAPPAGSGVAMHSFHYSPSVRLFLAVQSLDQKFH